MAEELVGKESEIMTYVNEQISRTDKDIGAIRNALLLPPWKRWWRALRGKLV